MGAHASKSSAMSAGGGGARVQLSLGQAQTEAPSLRERLFDLDSRGTYEQIAATRQIRADRLKVGDILTGREIGAEQGKNWRLENGQKIDLRRYEVRVTNIQKKNKTMVITGEIQVPTRTGSYTRVVQKRVDRGDRIILDR